MGFVKKNIELEKRTLLFSVVYQCCHFMWLQLLEEPKVDHLKQSTAKKSRGSCCISLVHNVAFTEKMSSKIQENCGGLVKHQGHRAQCSYQNISNAFFSVQWKWCGEALCFKRNWRQQQQQLKKRKCGVDDSQWPLIMWYQNNSWVVMKTGDKNNLKCSSINTTITKPKKK